MSKLLSVCMIIKNETATLKKCLSSIQPIADEIIIVDTGSTDNSKEIAKEFTTQIYNYIWENDFSKARNESIKYATGKWIMIIDADEYIAPADIDHYKNFLKYTKPSPNLVYSITVNSFLESGISSNEVGRIFPNRQGFHFHRPIHEQLTNSTPDKLRSANSNLDLFHSGYLPETIKNKKKSERNMAIFDTLKIKGKLTSYDHFTLANEYSVRNEVLRALYHYKRSFKLSELNNPWRFTCGYRIFYIYSEANKLDKASQLLDEMFIMASKYPDEYYLRATLYIKLGLTSLSKQYCELAFELAENLSNNKDKFYLINADLTSTLPLNMLLNISKSQKKYHDIIYYSTKLLRVDRRNINAISSIINTLITQGETDNIIPLFEKILGERTVIEDLIILRCCLNMGYADILSKLNFPSDFEIPLDSQLMIALINNDLESLNIIVDSITIDNINTNISLGLLIGSKIWGEDFYSHVNDSIKYKDSHIDELYQIINYDHSFQLTDIQLQKVIIDFLITLFNIGQHSLFNDYVEKFNDSQIINLLGQVFHTNNYTEISLSYFSILIENNTLDSTSAYLLGDVHLDQGYYEDAIKFYKHVIELDPSAIQAYMKIVACTQDKQLRTFTKEKMFAQFPKLKIIKILNNFEE